MNLSTLKTPQTCPTNGSTSPFGNPHVRYRVRSGIPQDSGLAFVKS